MMIIVYVLYYLYEIKDLFMFDFVINFYGLVVIWNNFFFIFYFKSIIIRLNYRNRLVFKIYFL